MNIVYTFDDGYSAITAVSMKSLLENNKEAEELKLFVVDCGISDISKKRFEELAESYNRSITFKDGKNFESKIPIKLDLGFWSFVCYVRLFFSELFPELDKVMHVDCDTLVRGSLSSVYNKELGDNLCAGCYDCLPTPKYMAGLPADSGYYSNGFLIFDLKRMRAENIQQKFIDYIVDKKGVLPHLDQDVVNAVLYNRILTLPPEYNLMTQTALFGEKNNEFFYSCDPFYDPETIRKAAADPIVVHLVGYRYVSRPWGQPCYHPYNEEWLKYYKDINVLFNDNNKLIQKKKKKYGALRELICVFWNFGYKNSVIRNIEFKNEKKRVRKKCDMYK